jgi:hypothetical protein
MLRRPARPGDVEERTGHRGGIGAGGVVEGSDASPPLHAWPTSSISTRRATSASPHCHSRSAKPWPRSGDSRRAWSGSGSVDSEPFGTSTPLRARNCRTSAAALRGATTSSERPWIASSGTLRAPSPASRPTAATSVSGPRFITVSAVSGEAAAPHAMPATETTARTLSPCRTPRIAASAAPADRPIAAVRAPSARRHRIALRIIAATIAASPRPDAVAPSNQFQQRYGFAASFWRGRST